MFFFFFKINFSKKNLSGIPSECLTVWIQIRPIISSCYFYNNWDRHYKMLHVLCSILWAILVNLCCDFTSKSTIFQSCQDSKKWKLIQTWDVFWGCQVLCSIPFRFTMNDSWKQNIIPKKYLPQIFRHHTGFFNIAHDRSYCTCENFCRLTSCCPIIQFSLRWNH